MGAQDSYPNKAPTVVNDWTAVAQNTLVKSDELQVDAVPKATMHIQAALDATDAHTGTRFIVQTSDQLTGDEDWQPHTEFVALIGTAATDAIENNPLAAGSTVIALTGHALTVEGKLLFIEDATLVNSEIVMESATATNAITIIDGTTNAHVATTAIFNVAAIQNVALPSTAMRARLIVDNTYDNNGSTLNYKLSVTKSAGV